MLTWRTAFEAALRERDPAKVGEACEYARERINHRILELTAEHAPPHSPEREEMEEALRQLVVWERSTGKK